MEALAKLRPVFEKGGTVTAGNASQLTDGAVALLVTTEKRAKDFSSEPLGYLRAYAYAGLDPRRMGLGPAFAIPLALKQAKLSLNDVQLWEINEAFSVQVLASLRALTSKRFCKEHLGMTDAFGEINRDLVNVNGGAVALGHPVGASGARLVLTLLKEMKRRNLETGVAALCVGGGQGAALVLERK
jgi:acetyl-CoA acetyltransferase family protein